MSDRVIGVDFGSSGLKLAEVRFARGTHTVLKQAFMPLDDDVVRNGTLNPEDVPTVAAELKAFLAAEKFGTKDAIMGLSSVDGIFVNRAITPWHAPKEFHTAIGYDIIADKSLLIGAPEDVIIDAVIFDDYLDEEENRKLDLLLCGVTSKVVQTQADVLQKAGLNVVGSDLAGLACLRATGTVPRKPGHLDVLVDVGEDVLTVLIHEGGKPYSLTLQSGAAGRQASTLIAEGILDEDTHTVNREKVAFSGDYRVRRAVEEYCHQVSAAIESALTSYLATHKTQAAVVGMTLVGGGALLHHLPDTLHANLGIPIVTGRFDPDIAGEPERYHLGQTLSNDYTVAVGLAMGAQV